MPRQPVWWSAPEPGDIVWCHFPQVPGNPGPKPRPALVLQVDDSNPKSPKVEVVYGTSKKTQKLYPGEFLISKARNPTAFKQAGLSFDTKFDFNNTFRLPYNSDWFAPSPISPGRDPILGSLHASLVRTASVAYQAASR